jgi:hypothetical protein
MSSARRAIICRSRAVQHGLADGGTGRHDDLADNHADCGDDISAEHMTGRHVHDLPAVKEPHLDEPDDDAGNDERSEGANF